MDEDRDARLFAQLRDNMLMNQNLYPHLLINPISSTRVLEDLLGKGWNINFRGRSAAKPFMWYTVHDVDLVTWCLDHGASVIPEGTVRLPAMPSPDDTLSMDERLCPTALEWTAAKGTVATFDLLRSKGAPLGWQTLHNATRSATQDYDPERMSMVRYLIDEVGLDVNALDCPQGRATDGRGNTPLSSAALYDVGLFSSVLAPHAFENKNFLMQTITCHF